MLLRMDVMPIVRIEVEGVKHAIVQHLAEARDEWVRAAAEEVAAFDIDSTVRAEVRRLLPGLLHDAIDHALQAVMHDLKQEVRDALRPQIQKTLSAVWDSVDDA